MNYYKLIDTVNNGKIVRFTGTKWEEYNIATGKWLPSVIIFNYLDPSSPFFELFEEISGATVANSILAQTASWKNLWFSAQAMLHEYKNLKSPISDVLYADYAVWLADFAEDEYQRVLYTLSGVDLLPHSKTLLDKYKIPVAMQKDVLQYHDTTKDKTLFQDSKSALRNAILRELEILSYRKDLEDEKAVLARRAKLNAGYSIAEAYSGITI